MGGKFPRRIGRAGADSSHATTSTLVSGWYDGRLQRARDEAEWEAVLPHLTLLRDMGCRYVVYADTSDRSDGDLFAPISAVRRLHDGDWPEYGRRLTQARRTDGGIRRRHGLPPSHGDDRRDRRGDRPPDGRRPARRSGFSIDMRPLRFSPAAIRWRMLKRHVGRVVHVHCKDARKDVLERARAPTSSFMQAVLDGVFTVPGDGFIDFPAVLENPSRRRLCRLAGRRGRAGSGQGPPADLCQARLRQSHAHGAAGRLQRSTP